MSDETGETLTTRQVQELLGLVSLGSARNWLRDQGVKPVGRVRRSGPRGLPMNRYKTAQVMKAYREMPRGPYVKPPRPTGDPDGDPTQAHA